MATSGWGRGTWGSAGFGEGIVIDPIVGEVALLGFAPSLERTFNVIVDAGTLALLGAAPDLLSGTVVEPSVGTVSVQGLAPDLFREFFIEPSVGNIGVEGYAPTIPAGSVITPLTGAINSAFGWGDEGWGLDAWGGNLAPLLVSGEVVIPSVGVVSIVGQEPNLVNGKVFTA
jgi:hypothetical protein